MKNKTQIDSAQNPKPFHFTDRAKPTNIADKNVSNKFSGLLIALNKNNKLSGVLLLCFYIIFLITATV